MIAVAITLGIWSIVTAAVAGPVGYWVGRRHGFEKGATRIVGVVGGGALVRMRQDPDLGDYVLIEPRGVELQVRAGDVDAARAVVGRLVSGGH